MFKTKYRKIHPAIFMGQLTSFRRKGHGFQVAVSHDWMGVWKKQYQVEEIHLVGGLNPSEKKKILVNWDDYS